MTKQDGNPDQDQGRRNAKGGEGHGCQRSFSYRVSTNSKLRSILLTKGKKI